MRETAQQFGGAQNLLGILSAPARESAGRPVVIILNAGTVVRSGPNRLGVELARALAAGGYPALRFDLSGLGDSVATAAGVPFRERALHDVRDAVDFAIDATGAPYAVLVGLCSGADVAHRAALRDPRVGGAVFLDGYAHPTLKSNVLYYASRVADVRGWATRLRKWARVSLGASPAVSDADDPVLAEFGWEMPSRADTARDLRALAARGAKVMYVFTGSWRELFLYERQLADAYPEIEFDAFATVLHLPESDHIFTRLEHRARLIGAIREWVAARATAG